jgi:hypothetical protein
VTNEELKDHFDAALRRQTEHFDRQVALVKQDVEQIRRQVEPIVALYMATTLSGKFTKALLLSLASLGTILLAAVTMYGFYLGKAGK